MDCIVNFYTCQSSFFGKNYKLPWVSKEMIPWCVCQRLFVLCFCWYCSRVTSWSVSRAKRNAAGGTRMDWHPNTFEFLTQLITKCRFRGRCLQGTPQSNRNTSCENDVSGWDQNRLIVATRGASWYADRPISTHKKNCKTLWNKWYMRSIKTLPLSSWPLGVSARSNTQSHLNNSLHLWAWKLWLTTQINPGQNCTTCTYEKVC